MIRRLMICCLSLSLLLTGCGQQEIALVPPQRDGVFRAELWEEERPDIQASLSPVDIVDTTFSHTDPGEEIARLLDRSPATVRSQLMRGRDRLRVLLEEG